MNNTNPIDVTDFPILKEVVHRDLPKNEQEWVLIYAFYASNFGVETFSRSDIAGLYESSNRKTDKNLGALSIRLQRVLKKGHIKFVNDTEYIIKPEGINEAKLILGGKSTSKPGQPRNNKKTQSSKAEVSRVKPKSSSKKQGFKLDRSLNLRPEGKKSLTEFAEEYDMDNTSKKILVIVHYLKEILEIESVNSDHIYTAFDKLKFRVPKSLYQLISDTKNKNGWLEFDTMDNIELSIQGGNAIKYDIAKTSK